MTPNPPPSNELACLDLALGRGPQPPPRATLRVPASASGPLPAAILLHGFKGFRRWGFQPYLAEAIARAGMVSIAIDFSGNGIGDDPLALTRLDLFEANTLAAELADVGAALDLAQSRPEVDASRLALVGHSRGGAVALLAAARDRRVGAVATLAAVADWERRFPPGEWERAHRQGYAEVVNARTGQVLRIGSAHLAELRSPELDPRRAASRLAVPVLLVHGDADESVAVEEGRELARTLPDGAARLVEIAGAGHTFGAVHPFAGSTPALERGAAEITRFLLEVFAPAG